MNTYEIFGLHDDQIDKLSEIFGDAVVKASINDGTMHVELSDVDVDNIVKDGFFVRRLSLKK